MGTRSRLAALPEAPILEFIRAQDLGVRSEQDGEKKTEVRKREIKGGDVMGLRWGPTHLNPITHFQDSDFHSEMEPGQE